MSDPLLQGRGYFFEKVVGNIDCKEVLVYIRVGDGGASR